MYKPGRRQRQRSKRCTSDLNSHRRRMPPSTQQEAKPGPCRQKRGAEQERTPGVGQQQSADERSQERERRGEGVADDYECALAPGRRNGMDQT